MAIANPGEQWLLASPGTAHGRGPYLLVAPKEENIKEDS